MALKPIKGVFAIPPSQATVADELLQRNAELTDRQLDTFRESGWRFIEAVDSSTPKPLNCRYVYRDSAGHVVIEGAGIVVKFDPSLDASQVESVLDTHGLRVKRRLGFVRNGFEVQPVESRPDLDMLELSNRLAALDEVEYAEPATIEAISKRDVQR